MGDEPLWTAESICFDLLPHLLNSSKAKTLAKVTEEMLPHLQHECVVTKNGGRMQAGVALIQHGSISASRPLV